MKIKNEVQIGDGPVINENLKVTTNLKTLLFITSGLFAVLISIFTFFYFDMKDRDAATNEKMETVLEEVREEVSETLEKELDEFDDQQDEMTKTIYEIQGDIKVILSHSDIGSAPTSGAPTINDHVQPVTTTPPVIDEE